MGQAAGTIWLEYSNGFQTFELHAFLTDFDTSSFDYLGTGAFVPTETNVSQTYAALAALWQPFYDPTWSINLRGILVQHGDHSDLLPTLPASASHDGTLNPLPPMAAPLRRIYVLRTAWGHFERVWLRGTPGVTIGTIRNVSPGAGGFQREDQDWIAYLSGNDTGACCFDGLKFEPAARMRIHFESSPTTPLPGYVLSG